MREWEALSRDWHARTRHRLCRVLDTGPISVTREGRNMAGARLCCRFEYNVQILTEGGMGKRASVYCHVRG